MWAPRAEIYLHRSVSPSPKGLECWCFLLARPGEEYESPGSDGLCSDESVEGDESRSAFEGEEVEDLP